MKALVTGITGQTGSYLAELLLEKGYEVHGMVRRASTPNTSRIQHIIGDVHLHYGDLTDTKSINTLIAEVKPDEVYNLAAQSDVRISFDIPESTGDIDGLGVLRMLEAIKNHAPEARFYQASTSELFGKVQEIPQSETTPFYPRSPYGIAKLYGFWTVKNYREGYGLHASNGILFNHESPRRGDNFVTQKVIKGLISIFKREQDCLYVGNIESKRDWGYAKDYVLAMWLMLQQPKADDYVIATGETHSVRELIEVTCKHLGIRMEWAGAGLDEIGLDMDTGKPIIRIDPNFYRPTEVDLLVGNPAKAKKVLGWEADTKFAELVKIMIDAKL